jgi:tRNA 2-thiouridine synthesizing protein A
VGEDKILTKPLRADNTIDTTGLYCPVPIVKTAERIKELETDSVLEVLSDDGGIRADLPAWCNAHGHEYLGLVRDGAVWRLYLRKKAIQ